MHSNKQSQKVLFQGNHLKNEFSNVKQGECRTKQTLGEFFMELLIVQQVQTLFIQLQHLLQRSTECHRLPQALPWNFDSIFLNLAYWKLRHEGADLPRGNHHYHHHPQTIRPTWLSIIFCLLHKLSQTRVQIKNKPPINVRRINVCNFHPLQQKTNFCLF